MAHFAKIDENNIVKQVVVVSNDVATNEQAGIDFLKELFGSQFNWKQTSYNATFRKNYAGIGYTYDESRDAFIPQKTFSSWILDEDTCNWVAPTPYPNDGKRYDWNEETKLWYEIE